MSYILDALRRAERERHAGRTPGVESLSHGIAAGAARLPPAIWVLALLTLAVAVAALLLALRDHRAPPPAATAPVASAAPAPAAPVAAPAAASAPSPREAIPLPAMDAATAIRNGEGLSSLDDVMTSDESAAEQDGATVIRARSRSAEDQAAASAPNTSPLDQRQVIKVDPALPPAPARETAPADNGNPAPVNETARKLGEMPESYRAQFPQFNLEIHNYSSEAGRSWIMVGGQRYKEGDSLANGARIAHIIEDGVIYDYGGAQVLLPNR
ncbi:general secretion pathway protein B [Solimonas aquatica]|uniref:General secretion pathway protein B n=1 Tax=Solimonas aquatica TaxID=489703 RepID=A0A1H9KGM6_9GAMM|nr:general secretion pathway protein GspB [Solimonas aquatica]SEQ98291.1 general secretion pathway protein B [Solimonas aquatica]